MSDSRFMEDSEEERVAQKAKEINHVYNLMAKKNDHYTKLWATIEEETEMLDDSSLTTKKKYEAIISVEFLLVRLRLLIGSEQMKVKEILSNRDTPSAWFKPFKERDVYLASFHQKLMEIREDVAVLQKAVYSYNTYSMK